MLLILAGGRGTRFWPRSRKRSAKQVLNVVGENSLIQNTVERLTPVIPPERMWVLTNGDVRDTIAKQLPAIPKRQILAEPAQRNTAPSIGLAAHILHGQDSDAVMGVFPADHVVSKPAVYRKLVKQALRYAAEGYLMVAGIRPRWPETGYGYIQFAGGADRLSPARVEKFHEKPKAKEAQEYCDAGYYWNSGMFFWRCDELLGEMRRYLPKTATILAALPPFGSRQFAAHLARAYPMCENIAIDRAVMERSQRACGIPAPDFGWNDVGSWNAVYELLAGSGANVAPADSVFIDSERNFVDARGKLVALVGVNDLIVVDTPDALLVTSRKRAQDVSKVVAELEKSKREHLL